jgi:hypothetical protein
MDITKEQFIEILKDTDIINEIDVNAYERNQIARGGSQY